jgi:hypothetical protein
MPSTDEILKALSLTANKYMLVAIFWHVVLIGFFFASFYLKQRISNHVVGYVLTLLLFSVSVWAWQSQNIFNGLVFLVTGIVFIVSTVKTKKEWITSNRVRWLRITGTIFFLSGIFYPHFLGHDWIGYLYAAPTGLIPCPTLLTVTGFIIAFNTKQSISLLVSLLVLDIFYGLFGVIKLHVYLDQLLAAASLALLLQIILRSKATEVIAQKSNIEMI